MFVVPAVFGLCALLLFFLFMIGTFCPDDLKLALSSVLQHYLGIYFHFIFPLHGSTLEATSACYRFFITV